MCNELNNYHAAEILVSREQSVISNCDLFQWLFLLLLAAEQCGADVICLNCHEIRSLAAGTTDAVKLSRFFDKVIERKYYPRGSDNYSSDKRKYTTQYSATSPPMFTSTSTYQKNPNYSTANGVI